MAKQNVCVGILSFVLKDSLHFMLILALQGKYMIAIIVVSHALVVSDRYNI